MTIAEKLAAFISGVTADRLSDSARLQLKIRVLDALLLSQPGIAQESIRARLHVQLGHS
jgi:hypothetical protein